MKNNNNNHFLRADGFTLPEVIMVVAVMAVVSAMAFPDIVSFFKRQSFEQEKIVQKEIIKALDAYSKAQTGHFADDPDMITVPLGNVAATSGVQRVNDSEACQAVGGWGYLLSGYSNLSAAEICNDVWGASREYTVAQGALNYRDGNFYTYHVTILSAGENKEFNTETAWGTGTPEQVASSYGAYAASGDDHLSKFSDVKLKTELFEETLRRMDRIVEALDRYAQARYNEALITEEAATGNKLFYPPSMDDINNMAPEASAPGRVNPRYGTRVINDIEDTLAVSGIDQGQGNHDDDMRGLMRLLGLPQEFCCNALTGKPFFYYSNPPIRCTPADYRQDPPFMPPKLAIDPICGIGY